MDIKMLKYMYYIKPMFGGKDLIKHDFGHTTDGKQIWIAGFPHINFVKNTIAKIQETQSAGLSEKVIKRYLCERSGCPHSECTNCAYDPQSPDGRLSRVMILLRRIRQYYMYSIEYMDKTKGEI